MIAAIQLIFNCYITKRTFRYFVQGNIALIDRVKIFNAPTERLIIHARGIEVFSRYITTILERDFLE